MGYGHTHKNIKRGKQKGYVDIFHLLVSYLIKGKTLGIKTISFHVYIYIGG